MGAEKSMAQGAALALAGRPPRKGLFKRIRDNIVIQEIIGRVALTVNSLWSSRLSLRSIDETRTDYSFWDKFRRGKAAGYYLGCLFAKPVIEIISSWELGKGFRVELQESSEFEKEKVRDEDGIVIDLPEDFVYTNTQLSDFLDENHALLLEVDRDTLALGDQFVIVNPDATLSIASPDTVDVIRDPLDYRRVIGYKITNRYNGYTVVDQYSAYDRQMTITGPDGIVSSMTYENLIGEIPIVHFSSDKGSNETFGRPVYEALLPLFGEYDDVIFKMLDGVKLMGNPIPSIEGLEDLRQVQTQLSTQDTETYTDKDGNEEDRDMIRFDKDAVFLIGKGGSLNFKGPAGGFTGDTQNALKSLFYLLLDHTRIPEFLWGGAVQSSKASTETQLPPWTVYIEERQKKLEAPIRQLVSLWLKMRALVDPMIRLDEIVLIWNPLVPEAEQLTLEKVRLADDKGWITDKTGLAALELVEDPEEEVKKAQKESEEAQRKFQELMNMGLDDDEEPMKFGRNGKESSSSDNDDADDEDVDVEELIANGSKQQKKLAPLASAN